MLYVDRRKLPRGLGDHLLPLKLELMSSGHVLLIAAVIQEHCPTDLQE